LTNQKVNERLDKLEKQFTNNFKDSEKNKNKMFADNKKDFRIMT